MMGDVESAYGNARELTQILSRSDQALGPFLLQSLMPKKLKINSGKGMRFKSGKSARDDYLFKLSRLNRYERRALSRRKSAIRVFDSMLSDEGPERREIRYVVNLRLLAHFGRTNPNYLAISMRMSVTGIPRPQRNSRSNLGTYSVAPLSWAADGRCYAARAWAQLARRTAF
jgi:hypothetical protein